MNAYERITQIIMDKLSTGVVPWRRPWSRVRAAGMNLSTLKPYRGINAMLTSISGFESPYWLTFNQARDLGANVRKGERGTPIVFFTKIEKEKVDGETEHFPMLRTYTIFNVAQVDNLKLPQDVLCPNREAIVSIDAAEAIIARMPQQPSIGHGGDRAFYRPSEPDVTRAHSRLRERHCLRARTQKIASRCRQWARSFRPRIITRRCTMRRRIRLVTKNGFRAKV